MLVHTGQHYDERMSKVFFDHLGMPRPDENLGVGSASHAVQTARVMQAFEPILTRERPEALLVAGDVNSTIACALVAVKLGVRVAHLEAGLRSNDWGMPEEINRILTDRVSHVLLTPSSDADENLRAEGAPDHCIHLVGNAMIDSLLSHLEEARATLAPSKLGLEPGGYALLTLHRPSNVDDPTTLKHLFDAVGKIGAHLPVVFPAHPRTLGRINAFGLTSLVDELPGLRLVEPLGYLEFLALQESAKLVLTDSGGIQEETTALGIPCLTLRENTERPVTVTEGTNVIVGTDEDRIAGEALAVIGGESGRGRIPKMWDGRTGERVAELFDLFAHEGFPSR